MRLLGRTFLVLVLLPPVLWGAVELWRTVDAWRGGRPAAALPDADARPVPTYVLGDERWTVFPLAARRHAVRLATHADVAPVQGPKPEWGWRYAVEYEILNASGEVIENGTQRYQAGLREIGGPDRDAVRPAASYLGGAMLPTVIDTIVIGLDDLPGEAATIRLRTAAKDTGVEEVNARIYEPEAVPDREIEVAWQRMSGADRRRLAAGNIYPPQLLSEEEKRNLLRWRWRPVGPRGVEGEDYEVKRLYVPDDGGVQPAAASGGDR